MTIMYIYYTALTIANKGIMTNTEASSVSTLNPSPNIIKCTVIKIKM